jgi:drug/metabolite transporter (DMT)-like permease
LGVLWWLAQPGGGPGSVLGATWAVLSGAIASGAGYAIWYTALPSLTATRAAAVQLTVLVLAALGGVVLLGEPISWRLVLSALFVLGGVGLAILDRNRRRV